MSDYCRDLHETYNQTITSFSNAYPEVNNDLLRQIDNYSRACALYIWFAFGAPESMCLSAINEIYSDALGKTEYSEEQMSAMMERLSEKNYRMPVPKFFREIISYDNLNRTNISSCLAACFQIMDISYALIDGEITETEADIIESIQRDMLLECSRNRISPVQCNVSPWQYVKSKKEEDLFVTAERIDSGHKAIVNPIDKEVKNKEKNELKADKGEKEKQTAPALAKDAMEELNSLIGLEKAKREIREVADFARVQKARKDRGLPASEVSFHLVFSGNPGTGKTTVARLVAKIYKELGIVSKGHLMEVSAKDLVAGYVGQTAIKTGEVIEKALGGVLFIDEAYSLLDQNGQGYGHEAIDTLLKEMEDKRNNLVVIVAGYDKQMREFINSNPGLKSRFNKYIHFDDYTADERYKIFELLCDKGKYIISAEAEELLKTHFSALSAKADDSFANGRTVRNVFEKVISKQASRVAAVKDQTAEVLSTLLSDDVLGGIGKIAEEKEETLDDVLKEFNSLIGLETVKEEISELVYIVKNQQKRKEQGLRVPALSLHLVFMGNPGTGKTTVARCVARLYKCLGLLSKGQLVETDRSGLVAGYVGQTAIKTKDVIQSAIGGVLFIDEAYTLANGGTNDFGQEAIDTLLKAMEDQREDLVVIVAGYDDLMGEFIRSNPGLESRFNRYIHFEDYSAEEMLKIFNLLCEKNQYVLEPAAEAKLKQHFETTDIASIGNGRGARNLFEKVVTQQAKRIGRSQEDVDLQLITEGDITAALMKG